MLKTVLDLLTPVFDDSSLKKLNKVCDKIHYNLANAIVEDEGKGSIFDNIKKINEYCSERLKIRVDLSC